MKEYYLSENRKYGWKRDKPDPRDFKYKTICPSLTDLPNKIDLRYTCSPLENQKWLGSCTAQALAGNIEFLENKESPKARVHRPKPPYKTYPPPPKPKTPTQQTIPKSLPND